MSARSSYKLCEILQARLKVEGETKEGRNNLGINIFYGNLNVLQNRLDSILTLAQLGKSKGVTLTGRPDCWIVGVMERLTLRAGTWRECVAPSETLRVFASLREAPNFCGESEAWTAKISRFPNGASSNLVPDVDELRR